MNQPDFTKGNGLVPLIIQDFTTMQVVMLGFMNEEALEKTLREGKVTFSASKRDSGQKVKHRHYCLLKK